MPPEPPQIPWLADRWRAPIEFRHLIGGVGPGSTRHQAVEQDLDLGQIEAGQAEVDLDVQRVDRLELLPEQLPVPLTEFVEPVLGHGVKPQLGLAQPLDRERRHGRVAKPLGGLDAGVAAQDVQLRIDQDRVEEAEPGDALPDLVELFLGMPARLARPRPQRRDLELHHPVGKHSCHLRSHLSWSQVRRTRSR